MKLAFCLALTVGACFAELKSAGPLAFGPNGVLFVGDSLGGSIVAVETGDKKASSGASIDISGINDKIAALLGTSADQIKIQDVAVNPISRNIYLSVARGAEASPVLLRTDASGKFVEVPLTKHTSVRLPNAPAEDRKRVETITDLGYVDGKVIVAGLSNEEFASTLRAIPYPFQEADKGAGIEIFHGAHGRFETNAPVRTFVNYEVGGAPHILAAYTCTPLVRIPVSELKAGNKVKGTTIAELGNRNRPLDMIVYSKDGKDYFLMANSSRGVMKLPAAKLDSYEPIVAKTDKQGVPYETLAQFQGVQQLDKFNDSMALMMITDGGNTSLRTVALP